jgi:3-phytase
MPSPHRLATSGLVLAALAAAACVAATPSAGAPALVQPTGDATAVVETEPVLSSGDAADDPAIWRDSADPSRSVIIGNDKGGALEVYDLTGRRLQRITGGFYGNVDTRADVPTSAGTINLVATYRAGLRLFALDPATRTLRNVTDSASGSIAMEGEGLCLYRPVATGVVYAVVIARSGAVSQVRLGDADGDGLVEGTVVRSWAMGSEAEGCVADDELGQLYISEEDVGIWRYDAAPTASTSARTLVDRVVAGGGRIRPDAEGLTIVHQPGGQGYLIASSQAGSNSLNSYLVYDRQPTNAFIREFKVVAGPQTDGCGWTDGIDALAADLGPAFPHGVFICQDNENTAPLAGYQNFKLVPLERVVALQAGEPDPPTATAIEPVGQAMTNANATTHRMTVPSTARAGDALVLLMGQNTTSTIGQPTGVTGWRQLGVVSMRGSRSTVWVKVAAGADAGAVVSVRTSSMSKAHLVLVAYRGTSTTDPVAQFAMLADPARSARHVTPSAATVPGAWALSYWTHKDSTTALLQPPAGVVVRAAGTQSGSGNVRGLVADSGGTVDGPSYGGLAATASTTAGDASMWTVVLSPRAP